MQLIGIALLGGMLVGCAPEPAQNEADNAAPMNRAAPLAVAIRDAPAAPAKVASRNERKILKSDGFPVPRGTAPAPRPAPARSDTPAYRAIGTEPFWAVTVRGTTATLERPGVVAIPFTVVRDTDGYRGDGFAMTISQGPCSDGMSDALWSDRVAIAFGEGVLKGCGGAREDEGARAP
ncbi:membrane-like protein [Sphingobium sp. KCTC 72723]|uniref:membrane-like protein n=1 Tax=Sphingobium sp. KCTC 72723 TaxID=2733867 RepID=UPI00165D5765|nr:membrane-like protein [Sphingobium sp. KCTC 72723]